MRVDFKLNPVIRTDTSGGANNGGLISGIDLESFGTRNEVWITRRCSNDIALGDATEPYVLAAHEAIAWDVCRAIYTDDDVEARFALHPGIGDAGHVYWVVTPIAKGA